MNKVILSGRLTKDPEVKQTGTGTPVCNITIACDRRFKAQDGTRQSDFINCVAWKNTATTLGNYFHKGSRIAVVGSLQTRTYDDQNGNKRYVTEVLIDEVEFVDSKAESGNTAPQQQTAQNQQYMTPPQPPVNNGFEAVEVISDANLPFDMADVGF